MRTIPDQPPDVEGTPLSQLAAGFPAWDVAEDDHGWVVARRGGSTLRACGVTAMSVMLADYEAGRYPD